MKNLYSLFFVFAATYAMAQDVADRVVKKPDVKRFLINISGGPSFRTGKTPGDLTNAEKDYIKGLKSGTAFDISTYYLVGTNRGYGLRFNRFSSNGAFASENLVDPSGETGPGVATDEIKIDFYGLGYLMQDKGIGSLDKFSLEIALGYISYTNNAIILNKYKITGSNLGISTSVSYHIGITKSILIGPSFSFTGGALKKLELQGNGTTQTIRMPKDQVESLYRVDFSLGARFLL